MGEGVAVLLQLLRGEQVVPEAAVEGGPCRRRPVSPRSLARAGRVARLGGTRSPFRSSTRGLLGRLSEKLVLAANFPPSTTSWDTTLRPLASGRKRVKEEEGCTKHLSSAGWAPQTAPPAATQLPVPQCPSRTVPHCPQGLDQQQEAWLCQAAPPHESSVRGRGPQERLSLPGGRGRPGRLNSHPAVFQGFVLLQPEACKGHQTPLSAS